MFEAIDPKYRKQIQATCQYDREYARGMVFDNLKFDKKEISLPWFKKPETQPDYQHK